jgi:MFS family permease
MFGCGLAPVLVAVLVLLGVKEPARWHPEARRGRDVSPLRQIFSAPLAGRTVVNTVLLTAAICGLWAGAVYAPTAVIELARRGGRAMPQAMRLSSFGMGLLSLGSIAGCIAAPALAERVGRKRALGVYFAGMGICIALSFGWVFYWPEALGPFLAMLFLLGLFGGNFAIFSLWLPEQYGTRVRATAFAFTTSFGRFLAAGVNFGLGALVSRMGTIGKPVAWTAVAFGVGLLALPWAKETRGSVLPD